MPLNPQQLARLTAAFPGLALADTCTVTHSWFGNGVSLRERAAVSWSKIGARTHLAPDARVHRSAIGRDCRIGTRATVGGDASDTRIGNRVRIGDGAAIRPGVLVGDGATIPPGAVVNADIAPADYSPDTDPRDPDADLPLREFLLEKLPLVHVVNHWTAACGDQTLRLDYPLDARSTVLDVGGFRGDWTAAIVARYRPAVHIFEPVRAFAAAIRNRFAAEPRVHVHDVGLAGATRDQTIALASEASSIMKTASPATETIRLVAADSILRQIPGDIALLKINIEGCEYELLAHLLDRQLMPRIRFLQVQFHDFVPGARDQRRALRQRLQLTHTQQWNFPFVWESWQRKE